MNTRRNSQEAAFLDERGVPVTTDSPSALEALEQAVLGLVGHRADTAQHVERALEHDPGLVPALCMQGFALKCLGRSDLWCDAQAKLRAAQRSLATRGGSERERGLCAALERWCMHDPAAAVRTLDQVLVAYPRDLLAFKLSHAIHFMLGQSAAMRAASERVLPAWDSGVAGFAYVLGCHAFALEETGALAEAESVGRRAVALDARDAWGAHAVAHVMEMRDDAARGIEWFERVEPALRGCNNFAGHLAWHRALLHMQAGDLDLALLLHDQRIAIYPARDYRDVANSATLLWRLEREGVALGSRWEQLTAIAEARKGDHALAFADAHYALVLATAGKQGSGERYVESMRATAYRRRGLEAETVQSVGLPLAEGMLALAAGRAEHAVDRILPLRRALARIGGSRAQRDIVELLLIEAAMQSDRPLLARSLLEQRASARPNNRFARERLALLASRARRTTQAPAAATLRDVASRAA